MRIPRCLVLLAVLAVLPPARAGAADCSEAPADSDGDGLCDALDPCTGGGAAPEPREATLTLRKLGARPGDDTLRFRGVVPLAADTPIDPEATGIRLTVFDGAWTANDVVVDIAAPGGAAWALGGAGRSWTYRAADPATSEVKRVLLKEVVPNPAYDAPRALLVRIDARRGTYGSTSDLDAHLVRVAFAGAGAAEVCAELSFLPVLAGWPRDAEPVESPSWQASCRSRGARTLACTSGPAVGPCRVGAPVDLMRCDAQRAAGAQEHVKSAAGVYHTGPCTELPGFHPSPDVECLASGDTTRFLIMTDHPGAGGIWCVWDNLAVPPLSCS